MIQLSFEPANMTFFIGKDLDHHITANIVMNAVGIRDSLSREILLQALQF